MRRAQTVQKVPFLAPDVLTKIIPSPTDGWDAISPLAEMDPKRAPILNNWVPRPGYVELRGGYVHFSGTTEGESEGVSPVETLMVYRAPIKEEIFAAAGDDIFNVTTGSPVSAVEGVGSARWQYINFTSAGGVSVIQCVNGLDPLQQYDGTTWTVPTITGLPTGVTTANFIGIYAQKQRLWYIPDKSNYIIYMPVGAITGAIAGTQQFGTLWTKGGYLMAMADWTIDGGNGPQDYAMFISNHGQVTLYAGTDPSNAAAWTLVGTFDVSEPIGRRCLTRVGSDVAMITQQGVIPISQALPFDPSADRSVAITARIQNAMASAALLYQGNFGWQFISYPNQQLAVLNVPQSENTQQVQFVMNTLTGAWCQFTGWNANCFELFKNDLYFGDNLGFVNKAYTGSADNTASINADMQCAFNWLDDPGRTKRITMVQPLLTVGGAVTPTLAIDTDFTTSSIQAPITTIAGNVLWDVAVWDVSQWPSPTVNYNKWLSVEALGHAIAIRMRVNITGTADAVPILQVNAFNLIAEMGGAI